MDSEVEETEDDLQPRTSLQPTPAPFCQPTSTTAVPEVSLIFGDGTNHNVLEKSSTKYKATPNSQKCESYNAWKYKQFKAPQEFEQETNTQPMFKHYSTLPKYTTETSLSDALNKSVKSSGHVESRPNLGRKNTDLSFGMAPLQPVGYTIPTRGIPSDSFQKLQSQLGLADANPTLAINTSKNDRYDMYDGRQTHNTENPYNTYHNISGKDSTGNNNSRIGDLTDCLVTGHGQQVQLKPTVSHRDVLSGINNSYPTQNILNKQYPNSSSRFGAAQIVDDVHQRYKHLENIPVHPEQSEMKERQSAQLGNHLPKPDHGPIPTYISEYRNQINKSLEKNKLQGNKTHDSQSVSKTFNADLPQHHVHATASSHHDSTLRSRDPADLNACCEKRRLTSNDHIGVVEKEDKSFFQDLLKIIQQQNDEMKVLRTQVAELLKQKSTRCDHSCSNKVESLGPASAGLSWSSDGRESLSNFPHPPTQATNTTEALQAKNASGALHQNDGQVTTQSLQYSSLHPVKPQFTTNLIPPQQTPLHSCNLGGNPCAASSQTNTSFIWDKNIHFSVTEKNSNISPSCYGRANVATVCQNVSIGVTTSFIEPMFGNTSGDFSGVEWPDNIHTQPRRALDNETPFRDVRIPPCQDEQRSRDTQVRSLSTTNDTASSENHQTEPELGTQKQRWIPGINSLSNDHKNRSETMLQLGNDIHNGDRTDQAAGSSSSNCASGAQKSKQTIDSHLASCYNNGSYNIPVNPETRLKDLWASQDCDRRQLSDQRRGDPKVGPQERALPLTNVTRTNFGQRLLPRSPQEPPTRDAEWRDHTLQVQSRDTGTDALSNARQQSRDNQNCQERGSKATHPHPKHPPSGHHSDDRQCPMSVSSPRSWSPSTNGGRNVSSGYGSRDGLFLNGTKRLPPASSTSSSIGESISLTSIDLGSLFIQPPPSPDPPEPVRLTEEELKSLEFSYCSIGSDATDDMVGWTCFHKMHDNGNEMPATGGSDTAEMKHCRPPLGELRGRADQAQESWPDVSHQNRTTSPSQVVPETDNVHVTLRDLVEAGKRAATSGTEQSTQLQVGEDTRQYLHYLPKDAHAPEAENDSGGHHSRYDQFVNSRDHPVFSQHKTTNPQSNLNQEPININWEETRTHNKDHPVLQTDGTDAREMSVTNSSAASTEHPDPRSRRGEQRVRSSHTDRGQPETSNTRDLSSSSRPSRLNDHDQAVNYRQLRNMTSNTRDLSSSSRPSRLDDHDQAVNYRELRDMTSNTRDLSSSSRPSRLDDHDQAVNYRELRDMTSNTRDLSSSSRPSRLNDHDQAVNYRELRDMTSNTRDLSSSSRPSRLNDHDQAVNYRELRDMTSNTRDLSSSSRPSRLNDHDQAVNYRELRDMTSNTRDLSSSSRPSRLNDHDQAVNYRELRDMTSNTRDLSSSSRPSRLDDHDQAVNYRELRDMTSNTRDLSSSSRPSRLDDHDQAVNYRELRDMTSNTRDLSSSSRPSRLDDHDQTVHYRELRDDNRVDCISNRDDLSLGPDGNTRAWVNAIPTLGPSESYHGYRSRETDFRKLCNSLDGLPERDSAASNNQRRAPPSEQRQHDSVRHAMAEQIRQVGVTPYDGQRNPRLPPLRSYDHPFFPRVTGNLSDSSEVSMAMDDLAMKYLEQNQLGSLASMSTKGMCSMMTKSTNLSFATVSYLERLQSIPTTQDKQSN